MVKLTNGQTGTEMWVDEGRVDEYLKLGHKRPKESKGKAGKTAPEPEPEPEDSAQRE